MIRWGFFSQQRYFWTVVIFFLHFITYFSPQMGRKMNESSYGWTVATVIIVKTRTDDQTSCSTKTKQYWLHKSCLIDIYYRIKRLIVKSSCGWHTQVIRSDYCPDYRERRFAAPPIGVIASSRKWSLICLGALNGGWAFIRILDVLCRILLM